ncbi:MAG TPA: Qat anti-phage system TatD family nuclease QatD [Puia sp.]|jgi:TatD DNase family protein
MIPLIDTHCHLDLFKDILVNASKEDDLGIKTITVTNAPSFFKPNQNLFQFSKNIRTALGLHPQLVDKYIGEISLFDSLIKGVRYVGEVGLDGSAEYQDSYISQVKALEKVLVLIRKNDNKIITVHSRSAASDTIDTVHGHLKGTKNKVILHWFSGTPGDLAKAVSNGFYFSINHKMVNTEKGKELIKHMPKDHLLTETDAPFTFDKQVTGRVQSLTIAINGIAAIHRTTPEEIRSMIFENFRRLVG